jgi:elongator complex protein 6
VILYAIISSHCALNFNPSIGNFSQHQKLPHQVIKQALTTTRTFTTMTSRIPHLLEPYLALPDEATLLLITGVLGASTNWLVLRHLHALLKPSASSSHISHSRAAAAAENGTATPAEPQPEPAVLLVSFLRDFTFWKENASRLGLDLEAAGRKGRFGYVDGLSSLFNPPTQGQGPQQQVLRGQGGWKRSLTSPAPRDIGRVIMEGVELLQRSNSSSSGSSSGTAPLNEGNEMTKKKVVLVIDGLDLVLAASNPTPDPGVTGGDSPSTAMALKEMLMDLREVSLSSLCISRLSKRSRMDEEKANTSSENTRRHHHPGSRRPAHQGAGDDAGEAARLVGSEPGARGRCGAQFAAA